LIVTQHLLTTQDVATQLHVTPNTVQHYVRQRKLVPVGVVRRQFVFDPLDVFALCVQQLAQA